MRGVRVQRRVLAETEACAETKEYTSSAQVVTESKFSLHLGMACFAIL